MRRPQHPAVGRFGWSAQAAGKVLHAVAPAIGMAVVLALVLGGCSAAGAPAAGSGAPKALRVVAAESFLADIAQNVAGERLRVDTLIPRGADPHSFEPSPADVQRVAQADLLIVNGAGLEVFLEPLLAGIGEGPRVALASAGLVSRTPQGQEGGADNGNADRSGEEDPHFWLDPVCVKTYVANIAEALVGIDPAGEATYRRNAAAYSAELDELDAWVRGQIESVPPSRRLLVTNHECLGYYADRYGLTLVGSILMSVSTEASPSAQELAELIALVRKAGVPAIFVEAGANPKVAEQIAQDTGVQVVTGLYAASLSEPDGPAPTYIDMVRFNTLTIVEALR